MMYFAAFEDSDGTWVYDDIVGPYTTEDETNRVAHSRWGNEIGDFPGSAIVIYECKPMKHT